jgi:hypothetical protein
LFSNPTEETLEAIHKERFAEGLDYIDSPGDGHEPAESFDTVYHLGIRTDHDELDSLMTVEEDGGPIVVWPLGDHGVKFSLLGEVAYLLSPGEVSSIAPILQELLDVYLNQRYHHTIEELGKEASDLEEIYPELRECFHDLAHFVQTAARHGEAIFWDLS